MGMKNEYKYLLNMGLAFDEDKAMKKLSKMAREGWVLKEMTSLRYKLVKDEPKELIYSMDYKKLDKDEKEYFELFDSSGWKHRCSYGPFHFFSAAPGAVPIYTDKENYLSKYTNSKKVYFKAFLVSLVILLFNIFIQTALFDNLYGGAAKFAFLISEIIGLVSAAIVVPSLMVCIAFLVKERKVMKNSSK
jgi:hypothetical protein